jgi:hypothetical protein
MRQKLLQSSTFKKKPDITTQKKLFQPPETNYIIGYRNYFREERFEVILK